MIKTVSRKSRQAWSLIKSLQTGLLLTTGLAGYMSARCPVYNLPTIFGLAASLFLAISGSTVLNMWYDRDIDARMGRTCSRPLPAGLVKAWEALVLGLLLTAAGVGLALTLEPLYGMVVFAGLFFDVVVYTLWLKRRTAWSIVWGGIAGGMPVLAGRVLGTGSIDWLGLALSLGVLFWIPTHIMTFSIRYHEDYVRAGVPTFPQRYGVRATRIVVAVSSVLSALSMAAALVGIGCETGPLILLGLFSFALLVLAARSLVRPSGRLNHGLFKYASVYMMGAMLLLVVTGL